MRKKIKLLIPIIVIGGAIISLVACGDKSSDKKNKKEITISAAASLEEPMKTIQGLFYDKTGIEVKLNLGGSGTLEKQIASGADVDMFFSANKDNTDKLIEKGYVYENKSYNFLENSLVVIGGKDTKELNSLNDLKNSKGKIAIGEINTVPAGKYAKESLEKSGAWSLVDNNLVYGKSVTNVKNYVQSGDAEYGFVYKTDAYKLKNSKIVYEIDDSQHEKIEYNLVILKDSKNKVSDTSFLEFLQSPEAKKIFEQYGFKEN